MKPKPFREYPSLLTASWLFILVYAPIGLLCFALGFAWALFHR